jgi:hypothetical protein
MTFITSFLFNQKIIIYLQMKSLVLINQDFSKKIKMI